MPTVIKQDSRVIGFAAEAARGGGTVRIRQAGFVSTEDGDELIDLLDQVSAVWLSKLPTPPLPSTIDHVVVIVRRDGTTQIFVNEVAMLAETSQRPD